MMFFLVLYPCARVAVAQERDTTPLLYIESDNILHNGLYLEPFFEKLYKLKTEETTKVNIVHIGDSHIQADYLTEVVRRNLQNIFGNAGRGLVVPYRVAGTNEPANFRSYSSDVWNAQRIVHPHKPLPIGIGGITLNTKQEGMSFSIRMNDPIMDYSFNSVSVFYQNDPTSFNFSILDSTNMEIGRFNTNSAAPNPYFNRVNLSAPFRYVAVKGIKEKENQAHATLFGLNFENGKHGLLYHAIGVNGAKYEHYNLAELFCIQTPMLSPDLFIISLGTNESVEYPNLKKNLRQEIRALIDALAQYNPDAAFILVTPPDAFQKKIKPNPGVQIIRNEILQFAVENGLAFWDMFRVSGGKDSAIHWRESGLLRPDGVHFTKEGYAMQGNLLFEAIMKSYQAYVAARHP